jgi:hypothetical protein
MKTLSIANAQVRPCPAWQRQPASPRSYRVQAHKQTCVCPHEEEVHARKWKLYTATQDSPLGGLRTEIRSRVFTFHAGLPTI